MSIQPIDSMPPAAHASLAIELAQPAQGALIPLDSPFLGAAAGGDAREVAAATTAGGAGSAASEGTTAAEHHDEAHGAPGYLLPHELPNIATWVEAIVRGKEFTVHHGQRPHPSTSIPLSADKPWLSIPINPMFSIVYAAMVVAIVRRALRRPSIDRPGRLQMAIELALGGLLNFFRNVLGEQGRAYAPFAATLFVFIFVNNIMCLVPFFKAPTSSLATTAGLGALTFCYVHFNVIRQAGFKSWFLHLVGEPRWLFFFNFPLHVLGELIKPVSLSARLFGNILGEDKLLAAFLGIGMLIVSAITHDPTPIVGLPLHLPFFFLVMLGSTIQALVFSVLASVYITLLLPHEEHHEDHAANHGAPEASGAHGAPSMAEAS